MNLGKGLHCEICLGNCLSFFFFALFYLFPGSNNLTTSGSYCGTHFSHSRVCGSPGGQTCFRLWMGFRAAPPASPGAGGLMSFSWPMADRREGGMHKQERPLEASAQNWQLPLPPRHLVRSHKAAPTAGSGKLLCLFQQSSGRMAEGGREEWGTNPTCCLTTAVSGSP